jgi:hypothetical protein
VPATLFAFWGKLVPVWCQFRGDCSPLAPASPSVAPVLQAGTLMPVRRRFFAWNHRSKRAMRQLEFQRPP